LHLKAEIGPAAGSAAIMAPPVTIRVRRSRFESSLGSGRESV